MSALGLFRWLKQWMIVAVVVSACGASAFAAPPSPETQQTEAQQAFAAARAVKQDGPQDIKFVDQATFKLPEGYVFIPMPQAGQLMTVMGNRVGEGLLGLVFPAKSDDGWFVVARYIKSGYIKDDDAKDWNADDMLASIKEGTEEANAERKARGIAEMEIVGWVETPRYDAAAHRLVWSLSSKNKGAPESAEKGVNYNTYALGREGYISMNLVTDLRVVEAQKPIAATLLGALEFGDGKRYADFNASTDHVAEYGLAALVGAVVVKKLGLFALIGVFIAKFAKVIAIGAAAFGATIVKLWKRNNKGSGSTPAP